jgi:hypothetical protein
MKRAILTPLGLVAETKLKPFPRKYILDISKKISASPIIPKNEIGEV